MLKQFGCFWQHSAWKVNWPVRGTSLVCVEPCVDIISNTFQTWQNETITGWTKQFKSAEMLHTQTLTHIRTRTMSDFSIHPKQEWHWNTDKCSCRWSLKLPFLPAVDWVSYSVKQDLGPYDRFNVCACLIHLCYAHINLKAIWYSACEIAFTQGGYAPFNTQAFRSVNQPPI